MKEYITLFTSFFKIGLFTFGGGMAMLPMLEEEIIVKNKWASKEEILDYFAIGQCTPGIIAVNTATFIGYFRKGILGSIIATLGIISPSLIIITIIASLLSNFSNNLVFKNAIAGVNIAVCVLIGFALYNLFKSCIININTFLIFIFGFIFSYFLNVPVFIIVIVSGFVGYILMSLERIKDDI